MKRLILILLLGLNCHPLFAKIDIFPFRSNTQEREWREITQSLRCPKCQNSSIADSDAMIAEDMRRKVFALQLQGKSRQEIIDYMTLRYGEFVTYQPPVTPVTLILWLGPLLILLGGGIIIVRRTHYHQQKDMHQ
ncbi:cytochrome c-type biogenesis protein [Scandinavium manionii]|uniref:cytochrome c-type biogenesis protein n=1 Tax=Scandinavium manionii TaxID=2926520 RepID=UPI001358C256|nr:cytochrome c-type biogenesis protein [Scandinavium manionii]MCS2164222.1 cytochrome c-type biogenesis protein CcmH [Scandinavium manionii]